MFYKGPHPGVLGLQDRGCIAELICSRLMDHLEIDHASTHLLFAKIEGEHTPRWIVRSKSYRQAGERSAPLDHFHELKRGNGETPLELCVRFGWGYQVAQVMVADYLTATRSRDASCFEVLCGRDGEYRLAPAIPRGASLTNALLQDVWRTHPLIDIQTDNYLGSPSLTRNLEFARQYVTLPPLDKALQGRLLAGLNNVAPDNAFLEGAWNIIRRRWINYESICNL